MKSFALRFFHLLLIVLLLSGCRYGGIIDRAPVKLVKSERTAHLVRDTAYHAEFPEVMDCADFQILCDTIIVFFDNMNGTDGCHFKCYSTDSFKYLGSFCRKGRGPGELVSPRMIKGSPSEQYLYLKCDSVQGCAVDVTSVLSSPHFQFAKEYSLPAGSLIWLPLPDSKYFLQTFDSDRSSYSIRDADGTELDRFEYRDGMGFDRNATFLSSIFLRNERNMKVAEVMLFLPQINFFDTSSGACRSVAVDSDYRRWKTLGNTMLNMDSVQYFTEATASSDYILAAYACAPLGEIIGGERQCGTSIQVFDWDGRFKCDIKVAEDLKNIAFDDRNRMLYGIRKTGEVVRYNLDSVLK